MMRHGVGALAVAWVAAGCLGEDAAPGGQLGRVGVDVAALSLVGVGDVIWDVEVVNGANPAQVVWQKRLASSRFGDGAGSASWVGPCDADPAAAENVVRVWVVGVYDAPVSGFGVFAAGAASGPGEVLGTLLPFQSPTASGPLTRTVTCREGADAAAVFDVALARPAQQGFFDVAVAFADVFCSAKLDCCDDADLSGACDAGEDIDLLFDASGARGPTLVLAFACTGGVSGDTATALYLNDVVLDCSSPSAATFAPDITLDPSGAPGNQCVPGDNGMGSCLGVVSQAIDVDADEFLFQIAIFRGSEALTSGGVSAQKVFWNVALGVKRPAIGGCWLRAEGMAVDGAGAGGTIAAGAVYPYVQWEADLGECTAEALSFGAAGAMVRPAYTGTAGGPTTFAHAYAPAAPPDPGGGDCGVFGVPCPDGFACTAAGTCEDAVADEVWVPAGTFWMGCNADLDADCFADEAPQHEVTLSAYAIGRSEVTAAGYKACVTAGACTLPTTTGGEYGTYDPAGKQSHPVNFIGRDQAAAFCAWNGQRLCTEAEWERAARGGCETVAAPCQASMRKYAWDAGDGSPPSEPTCSEANFQPSFYCEPIEHTVAVTALPAGASPYGALNLQGNVWEWVSDWYGPYAAGAATDPTGPASGTNGISRGGSYGSGAVSVRAGRRFGQSITATGGNFGARCCRSLP